MNSMIRKTINALAIAAVAVGILGASAGAASAATLPAYVAPHVTYSGASCTNLGGGNYRVVARYTAAGGRYTDLGSYGHRARVNVTGQTRTFLAVSTITPWGGFNFGGASVKPTSYMGSASEMTAALNWNGTYRTTHVINTLMDIHPITCR